MKKMPKRNSEKSKKTDTVFVASMNDDLLRNILRKLPAKSFAFASCVNRSWNSVCNHILARPKMVSAFSRNHDQLEDTHFTEPIIRKLGDTHFTEPIIRKLDYAMPAETIIVCDQKGEFLHKRANESINVQLREDESRVLAEAGGIQFHAAISRGTSSVDLRYKAANAIATISRCPATLVTAKRIGEAEVLNGDQIQDDLETNLVVQYIGVMKGRKYRDGLEKKPKNMTSLVFHQVIGADEQYLTVSGAGIKTGDHFQVYIADPKVAEASLNAVSSRVNLKSLEALFGRPNAAHRSYLLAVYSEAYSWRRERRSKKLAVRYVFTFLVPCIVYLFLMLTCRFFLCV